MGNLTHTVSGDIASFRSAARVPIESLKCHFLPIQEGTGDPSPDNIRPITGWQGITINKCKKNLFNFGINNVEYDVPNDKGENRSVYHTGIISDGRKISISAILIDTELTSNTQINLGYLQNGTLYQITSFIAWDTGVGYSRTVSIPIGQELLLVNSANSAWGWTRNIPRYNIQIEINDINTIFEPYCNDQISIIFPILGKNKLPLTNATTITSVGTGYNNTLSRTLTPGTIYQNVSVNNYWLGQSNNNYTNNVGNGEITYMCNDSAYGQGFCIEVLPSTQYIASIAENEKAEIRWSYFDAEGNCIGYDTIKKNKVITTPIQTKYALIVFTISSSDYKNQLITVTNAQVEFGSTATTYEPYSSNNTVYCGYVDIAKGEIIETHKKKILNGTETWSGYRTTSDPGCHFVITLSDKKIGLNGTISDTFPNANNIYFWDRDNLPSQFGDHGTLKNLYFNAPYPMTNGVTEWKQWLSEHNVTIVYPLENPIHYPILKQNIASFLDQNNIQSNTNDITEVSYQIHDSNMIRSVKKQIIGNEPHIETVTGSVASFNTDMRAPIESAKVYFNPIQDEGYPSPILLKPITGWTGININYNDENYNISWQNITGIIYGGYVNIIKGELVKTWESVLLDDPDKWLYISQDRTDRLYYDQQFDAYFYKTDNQFYSLMSSYWTTEIGTSNYMRWKSSTDKRVAMMTGRSLEDVKQDASDGKIQIAYMLNTPIHYQLSPTQLKSLIGQNNIWSNANGDIEVKYWTH